MAKFNVTVVRSDEYEIEIDETVWTPQEIKEWGKIFWGGTSLEDVAKALGEMWMKQGSDYFKEGFGYVRELHTDGSPKKIYVRSAGKLIALPEKKYARGLTIKPISEDSDYEVELRKLNIPKTGPKKSDKQ